MPSLTFGRLVMGRLSPLWLYRVGGDSMLPTYLPGDTVLGLAWFVPAVGQVVVARLPVTPAAPARRIIKRIIRLEPNRVWLQGDNPAASTDSRDFGPVDLSALEAVILAHQIRQP